MFRLLPSPVPPHCTIWFPFSDAQLPDTLRVVYTNLARASQFWSFWYRILDPSTDSGGRIRPDRTTRQTVSVDENTRSSTPYNLPTTVDRTRGKAWKIYLVHPFFFLPKSFVSMFVNIVVVTKVLSYPQNGVL